jgi:tetratricopeptide (TPR) repeat protein
MSKISKGSVLKEVSPYLVANDTDNDPTRVVVPNLKELLLLLPRWNSCPIWEHHQNWSNDLFFKKPKIKKFLRRARRKISLSSPDDTTDSWRILCILVTLCVVANNTSSLCDDNDEDTTTDNNSVPTQENSNDDFPLHWWSVLVSDHNDDDNEKNICHIDDDDDDDNDSLLVELWPLIRDCISWKACQRLYLRVQNIMHMLIIPHPLTAWAQTTIFELTNEEFETSWKIFQNMDYCQEKQKQTQTTQKTRLPLLSSPPPPNRLLASKLWLDLVANIPERLVGVLIEDPLKVIIDDGDHHHQSKTLSNKSSNKSVDIISSSALTLSRCYQSCMPNTCLEIHAINEEEEEGEEKDPNAALQAIENNNKQPSKLRCRWIALYDLSGIESEEENRTLSTMPKSRNCACFQCVYEKEMNIIRTIDAEKNNINTSSKIEISSAANLTQTQRLAHSYFHQEKFKEAMSLYQQCHRYCKVTKNSTKETMESLAYTEADLWHTMGAVLLSQLKFACAQQHWKNGSSHYKNIHKELSEQLEQQRVYQYFNSEPHCMITKPLCYETIQPSDRQLMHKATNDATQSVFVASDVIDVSTCQKLIQFALDYALNNGGWTTSRHYSVPTTDLPIHHVPKLLEWFQEWMPQVLFPLLRDQFGIVDEEQHQCFYVHDAFLVRYEATASNCFLPLHFDESTHSCVLALNDDFDGGGSYMCSLNQTVAPSTGGMISFMGNQVLHGGTPVVSGQRYILAIFLYLDKALSYNPPPPPPPQDSLNRATEMNKTLLCPIIVQNNGKKRREEVINDDENDKASKRFKEEDEPKVDKGDGGGGDFSFSFF